MIIARNIMFNTSLNHLNIYNKHLNYKYYMHIYIYLYIYFVFSLILISIPNNSDRVIKFSKFQNT